MSTERTDLEALSDAIDRFVQERDWDQFHDPKNLVMLLTSEVGELAAEFRWVSSSDADAHARGSHRAQIEDEIADVMIGLIMLARRMDVDLVSAVRAKLAKNAARYPVAKARGQAERPL